MINYAIFIKPEYFLTDSIMSLLFTAMVLFISLPEQNSLAITPEKLGSAVASVVSTQAELLREELPVKEEDLPMWRQVITAVMNETDDLDDVIYKDGDDNEPGDDELQNRFGEGFDDKVSLFIIIQST